jgi:hypothetical protein
MRGNDFLDPRGLVGIGQLERDHPFGGFFVYRAAILDRFL